MHQTVDIELSVLSDCRTVGHMVDSGRTSSRPRQLSVLSTCYGVGAVGLSVCRTVDYTVGSDCRTVEPGLSRRRRDRCGASGLGSLPAELKHCNWSVR